MTVQLPFDQAHPLDVAPLLRQLQQDGVVHQVRTAVGDQAWLVTGHEEVRRLLADDRLGRSHPDPVSRPPGWGSRCCSVGRWATTTPSKPTTPGCAHCCSRISHPGGCGHFGPGWKN